MVEDAVPLEAVHRALVVKLRHQGDVLLASPVFSAPLASGRHVGESTLDALRRIGIYPAPGGRALTLVAGTAAEERVARLLAERGLSGQSFVQVHPSSRWRFKCWPAEKMAALIDRLHARGLQVALTGAPDPAQTQMIDDIQKRLAQPVAANLAGAPSLKELAALTA